MPRLFQKYEIRTAAPTTNIMPPARLSPRMVPMEGCEEPIEGVAEGDVECNELMVSDSVLVEEPEADALVSRVTENDKDVLLLHSNVILHIFNNYG